MAMRRYLPLFLGYFAVMALSNAIVPVLPAFTRDTSVSGLIYAGYFLGAFFVTLPAGILADRYGYIVFVRLGLFLSLASGVFLAGTVDPVLVLAGRLLEGAGAGLFVAAAMAAVNAAPDHVRLSGWLMASQNAGLVTGLAASGLLAASLKVPAAGIALFAVFLTVPTLGSLLLKEPERGPLPEPVTTGHLVPLTIRHRWLWYSTIMLIGMTGVASSLYPQHAGTDSGRTGIWLALMSIATIISVLICSRRVMEPARVIRFSAILMSGGILLLVISPAGFILLGAAAGAVMIAQMAFLAGTGREQGTVMGLYSSFAYLGMAAFPAVAGMIAKESGFFTAYLVTALAALSVAVFFGRCQSIPVPETAQNPPAGKIEQ